MAKRKKLDPDKVAGSNPGADTRALGPSDSSDTGADLIGPGLLDDERLGLDRGTNADPEGGHLSGSDPGASVGDLHADSSTDNAGTGEHMTAGKEPDIRVGGDIAPDRIVGPEAAGLGGGLDEAEEAHLGITDEELQQRSSRR